MLEHGSMPRFPMLMFFATTFSEYPVRLSCW